MDKSAEGMEEDEEWPLLFPPPDLIVTFFFSKAFPDFILVGEDWAVVARGVQARCEGFRWSELPSQFLHTTCTKTQQEQLSNSEWQRGLGTYCNWILYHSSSYQYNRITTSPSDSSRRRRENKENDKQVPLHYRPQDNYGISLFMAIVVCLWTIKKLSAKHEGHHFLSAALISQPYTVRQRTTLDERQTFQERTIRCVAVPTAKFTNGNILNTKGIEDKLRLIRRLSSMATTTGLHPGKTVIIN